LKHSRGSITLADTAEFRLTLHHPENPCPDHLVITFGGEPSGLADHGFGTAFCLRQGWSTIYVAQRNASQYQGLSLEVFGETVAKYCQGKDVICYGSSLGGYAAIYYGGAISARIIAAAPLFPAWIRPKSATYSDILITHAALSTCPVSVHRPVILYDPMRRAESRMVDEMILPVYPAARLETMPFGGHEVLQTLARMGQLKEVITTLIREDRVIDFRRPAEGDANWHAEKGWSLIRSDPGAAVTELKKSLQLADNLRTSALLIQALILLGRLEEAQDKLDQISLHEKQKFKFARVVLRQARDAGLRT